MDTELLYFGVPYVDWQALDDVWWMAVYNLSITSADADTQRFYDILLPFLTGTPAPSPAQPRIRTP